MMLGRRTPAVLLDQQTDVLRSRLAGVQDGDVDAVHDARVATRRIRELLALVPVAPGRNAEEDVAKSLKAVGRALGRVRDIDVQIAVITGLETHTPQAAPSLAFVRQDHEHQRLRKMRRAIKALEEQNVDVLLHAVADSHPAGLRRRLTSNGWRHQLRHLVMERARTALDAIAHATGVYFPNRAHRARIAIKQVRYAGEIAAATRLSDLDDAIKALRKGQDILGDLHDRQSLTDTLDGYMNQDRVDPEHLKMIRQVLDAEVLQLHAQYLARRAALRDACAELQRIVFRIARPQPLVAVGSALSLAGVYYAHRLRRHNAI